MTTARHIQKEFDGLPTGALRDYEDTLRGLIAVAQKQADAARRELAQYQRARVAVRRILKQRKRSQLQMGGNPTAQAQQTARGSKGVPA